MRIATLLPFLLLGVPGPAQDHIVAKVDLREKKNDRVEVELIVPPFDVDQVTFALPRIVPGIYGVMDHGRLMGGIAAFDPNGEPIPVRRLDVNRWAIPEARALHRINYSVDDGWEEFDIRFMQGSYRSSEGTVKPEVALINHNTVVGYFEGYETLPYIMHLQRPSSHYVATSLPRIAESAELSTFQAKDYRHLVDDPMMVAIPDTAQIHLPDITVLVACHSTTGKAIAHDVAAHIRPLLADQRAYLGGTLPVKDYTFLIYHNPSDIEGSSMGDGLEHAASTVILLCMPLDPQAIAQSVYGIASHEFFHTILPLSVHSEEIEHYDFQVPRMSRHLWLYEGMTEYFAIHMPVKQGRQTVEEFLAVVNEKIGLMRKYPDDQALTTLSQHALEEQDQYYNFYLKGTLFCMGLDILLRERSKGAYGVQELVQELQRTYGPGKPFKDDELFTTIENFTGPDIGLVLQRHLNEPSELPLDDWLGRSGIVRDDKGGLRTDPEATKQQRRLRSWWLGR